jgi:hypothetical protein
MVSISEPIVIEWIVLNSVLIVVSAVLVFKCYKERRRRTRQENFI